MRSAWLIPLIALALGCEPPSGDTEPTEHAGDAGPEVHLEGLPDGDADGDGVRNGDDLCDDTPPGAAVWPTGDWAGCAEGQSRDRQPPPSEGPQPAPPPEDPPAAPPPEPPPPGDPPPEDPGEDDPDPPAEPEAPMPPAPQPDAEPADLGSGCEADADCDTGRCLDHLPGGYCSQACSDASPCPDGGACWSLRALNGDRFCLASCEQHGDCRGDAGYICDGDATCYPGPTPPADPNSDAEAPFGGPPPACDDLPDFRCDGADGPCGELVPFLPAEGDGYWNYPLNGESEENQYRSYIRRDLMLLIKYAAAHTRCRSQNWDRGNHAPLGLGDMSEANGAIPGTSDGDPGHPPGSHTDGLDLDIAYYQTGNDNLLRPVCEHTRGGAEQSHCTADPHSLDVWRTALFLALLHHSPQLRIIGVDGRIGPRVAQAIETLCARDFVDGPACDDHQLAWETTEGGRGWFRFHHHHFHVSILPSRSVVATSAADACITPGCVVH